MRDRLFVLVAFFLALVFALPQPMDKHWQPSPSQPDDVPSPLQLQQLAERYENEANGLYPQVVNAGNVVAQAKNLREQWKRETRNKQREAKDTQGPYENAKLAYENAKLAYENAKLANENAWRAWELAGREHEKAFDNERTAGIKQQNLQHQWVQTRQMANECRKAYDQYRITNFAGSEAIKNCLQISSAMAQAL